MVVGTVTSFGIGGSNGLLLLESFPVSVGSDYERNVEVPALTNPLVLVGGLTKDSVVKMSEDLCETSTISKDVCIALQRRARLYPYRAFAIGKSQLLKENFSKPEKVSKGETKKLVFVFSGQGQQYATMGQVNGY